MPSLQDTFANQGSKDTRSGFGAALLELGSENQDVVALCADLTGSLKMNAFRDAHPDRFFQIGIAEANMMGIAAGMTIGGKIPFTGTFANFSTGRVYDQIRQSIAYSLKNVKICASHSGLTLGEDGATHQILEDVGMMKMLPGMTVISTCDYNQTYMATKAIAELDGPVYLRFGRPKVPNYTSTTEPFQIGKAVLMGEGSDITIFSHGHLVWESVVACDMLAERGISAELINVHSIKPLDTATILASLGKTQCAVVAEEHQILGGLGGSIAQLAATEIPVPIGFVGVQDTFGESGTPDELMIKYGLKAENIVKKAEETLARKK